jgi:flagellar motor switch protein FliM
LKEIAMTPELPQEPGIDARGLEQTPPPAYDVCNPDRLPADRVTFVDAIHQQFLQSLGLELSNYLDMPVKASPAGIDQIPVATFLAIGNEDACVITLDLASTRGQAWVGLSAKLVFHILDILLGTPQPATPAARATITEIERHVLAEFFDTLVVRLVDAWAPSGISLRMGSIGTIDQARQAADLDGTALVLNCSVRVQEQDDTFRVAVPVLAVRLAAQQNEQKAAAEVAGETAARTALLETVGTATLELEAYLGGSSIRLGDLAAMQAGQILVLTQPAGSQLDCVVNGKTKFRGEWIALGDRHGLQVESLVDAEVGGKKLAVGA